MGFVEAVQTCLRNYVGFSGRASRPEYWWFVLFVFAGSFVASLIDSMIFGWGPNAGSPISGLFQLATLLPLLAAGWRRMQDSGKPGWYILIPFVVSVLFAGGMLLGVFGLGMIERGVGPDAIRGPAMIFGGGGMFVAITVQLAVLALMIWWLTRPGDEGANRYGPPPRR